MVSNRRVVKSVSNHGRKPTVLNIPLNVPIRS